jgi:hypothetical protein
MGTMRWRCGWSADGRRFYFHTSGSRITLSGPRAAVRSRLRELLPAWREVAATTNAPADIMAALDCEIAALGLQ